ncbi:MAG: hypothetical protein ACHQRM_00385 [Bacteroidia bacterium]
MKRAEEHIKKLPPPRLLNYMSERQYPALNKLIDRISAHLEAVIRKEAPVYPFLFEIEKEFMKITVLVRKQINKNTQILFPFIDNAWEEGAKDTEIIHSLELERADLQADHHRIETHLSCVTEIRQRIKPGIRQSSKLKMLLSELTLLDKELHWQFNAEDKLLFPKPSKTSHLA